MKSDLGSTRVRLLHINLDMLWAMASIDIPALQEGLHLLLEQEGAE